jgi:hypothetical protein
VADSDCEKTHVLMQDCIVSQFGRVQAGFEISQGDVDSLTWSYLERNGMLKSIESIVADADANDSPAPVVSDEPPAQTGEESDPTGDEDSELDSIVSDDASVISAIKMLLSEGKMQLKTIGQQAGIAEEVIAPLLTEANGFTKNQQGWFSLV